jgi:RND family efflux transporter MFP subunit
MARPLPLQLAYSYILLTLLLFFGFTFNAPVHASETVTPKPYYRTQLLSGFTKAKQTAQISSEVAGKCLAIHAEIGTAVPESGILAEIDDTFIKLDIQANRLEIESVKRQLLTEKKTLGRYTTLLEKNSSTEAKLDEVTLSADLHEMTIETLNNQYQRLQENLARHTITAPKGWILIERMIEPGEYVQTGQAVANIGDFSEMLISLALSYNELKILRQSETIPLYFPDIGLKTTARLYRVSPTFTEATKKIPVDLIIENNLQENSIRGGLRAELHLKQQEETAFVLPFSALINRYDAYWIVKENNERMKVIFLGKTDNGASAIVSSKDLTDSDKIYRTIPENFE